MREILDSLKSANFNTIFFQVRARGDLLYPSIHEPWGRSMTGSLGQNPGYDVLQFVIDEVHERGMEIHAWFVTYKVYDGQSIPPVTSPLHILRSHPEWCRQYNDNGSYTWWLDPGIPQVKDYLTSVVMEIIRNYQVDGIHFDYIRYPESDFDDAATFSLYGNGMSLGDWRRDNINQFVYQVYDSIATAKPDIKTGSAPIGIYKNLPDASGWQGYYDIFQDSRNWLGQEKHDYICPQVYWDIANPPSDPSFPVLVSDWVNNSFARHVYTGIAAYRMNAKDKALENNPRRYRSVKNNWPASEILNEVDTARALGSKGQTFFSANEIFFDLKNIHSLLKSGQYQYPAHIPPMSWKDSIPPLPVRNLSITNIDSINFLVSWNQPLVPSDGDTVKYYTVYYGDQNPVDISDISRTVKFQIVNMLDALITLPSVPVNPKKFTVTAFDNGYNESIPATEVSTDSCKHNYITAGNWQTGDFQADFADSAFLHTNKRFYQVLDYNGDQWAANPGYGFFYDNFDSSLHQGWQEAGGSWSSTTGWLQQSDQADINTNIYSGINQSFAGTYLYQWKMNIGGTGTNRRAGLHFFCSDATQADRGNSYLVYFRADNDKVQIYKSIAGNMFLAADDNCNINTGIWYDCKVMYDQMTGKISVWLDNLPVSSWTDTVALQTGNSVSFRSGECNVLFDNFRVFRSRGITENISAGDSAKETRYQNTGPSSPACMIQSVTATQEGYFSSVASCNVNIDWTPPLPFTVFDETADDPDTTFTSSSLKAVWTRSSDPNSGIEKYMAAFGTTQGGSDITGWTDIFSDTSFMVTGLNLQNGHDYYCSVKAMNAAGLVQTSFSDGITVILAPLADFTVSDTSICEGNLVSFSNLSENADLLQWTFEGGYPGISTLPNPMVLYDTTGVFNVEIEVEGPGGNDTLIRQGYIHVAPKPKALFSVNDSILVLPAAIATFTNLSTNAGTYFWDFGDGYTSTDENPWHSYISDGVFTVTLIAYHEDCGTDTIVMHDYIQVVNTNAIAGNTMSVFLNVIPNPVNERAIIYFELRDDAVVSLSLTDVLGKEIVLQKKKMFEQGIHIVSLSPLYPQLSGGIYFIKMTSDNKTSVVKFTK